VPRLLPQASLEWREGLSGAATERATEMEKRSGIDPKGGERFQGEENAHAQVHGNATAS